MDISLTWRNLCIASWGDISDRYPMFSDNKYKPISDAFPTGSPYDMHVDSYEKKLSPLYHSRISPFASLQWAFGERYGWRVVWYSDSGPLAKGNCEQECCRPAVLFERSDRSPDLPFPGKSWVIWNIPCGEFVGSVFVVSCVDAISMYQGSLKFLLLWKSGKC